MLLLPPNWTLRMANLLMLKRPRVQPSDASTELSPCGHCPSGLWQSRGISYALQQYNHLQLLYNGTLYTSQVWLGWFVYFVFGIFTKIVLSNNQHYTKINRPTLEFSKYSTLKKLLLLITEGVDTSALSIFSLRDGPWRMVNMQSYARMIHFVP